jgi:cell division protein FtsB
MSQKFVTFILFLSIFLALPSLLAFNLDKIQRKTQQAEIETLKASVESLKSNIETLEGENLSLKQKASTMEFILRRRASG